MPSKNFILLSLDDTKTKKVANAVSNDSCRKILDYLGEKQEATESELAVQLQIPISTVHYNLQQLMESGLVTAEEFHYSQKGKEVSHYKLANKYIIIAPKKTFGINEKLKAVLPVALIVGATALVLQFVQKFLVKAPLSMVSKTKETLVRETFITQKASEYVGELKDVVIQKAAAARVEQEAVAASMPAVKEAVNQTVNKTVEYALPSEVVTQTITTPASIWANIALWFLIGAVFALLVYFVVRAVRKRVEL